VQIGVVGARSEESSAEAAKAILRNMADGK
jgi:hypothetical protein